VTELSLFSMPLPMSVVFGMIAAGVYLISCLRHRHGAFTMLDTLILVSIMGAVSATSAPLLQSADESTKSAVLQKNLRVFRQQIELYKLDHDGKLPLLFKGEFPQLTSATDSEGVPGPRGDKFPHGPYFSGGLPSNPYTGSSVVEPTETFPPSETTGTAGWLYHQPSGRIAADVPGGID
jgi:general secretion pathway protein G